MPEAERRSVSPRTLAAYSALFAVLLVGLAFVAYRELLHYERRAVTHVPADAAFALRVDLEQLVLFEPVRNHLLALVDHVSLAADARATGDAVGEGERAAIGRLTRLREEAGLNLGLELRELVFASYGAGQGWVLAAGGLFPGGDLLERVAAVLAAEPGALVRQRGSMLLLGPGQLALTRASDGVLLLGSSASALDRARVPSQAHRALGIGQEGALAFVARAGWLEPSAASPAEPAHAPPSGFERVRGRLDYGDPFELTLELEGPSTSAPREALERWLRIDAAQRVPTADWGGERAILARASFTPASAGVIRVSTTWQRSEFDHACKSLAVWLEGAAAHLGPVAQ